MLNERFIPRLTRRRAVCLVVITGAGYLNSLNIQQGQNTDSRISLINNKINNEVSSRMAQLHAEKPEELRKPNSNPKLKREWEAIVSSEIAQTRESAININRDEMSYLKNLRSVLDTNILVCWTGILVTGLYSMTKSAVNNKSHFVSAREVGVASRKGLGRLFRRGRLEESAVLEAVEDIIRAPKQ